VKVGVIVPQGWTGEYDGWDPRRAWSRTLDVARQADELGFESIWLFDHLHTTPEPTDEITFESFTALSALAAVTERVRLGHIVICGGFRNPALVAKMISTMDVISAGRMDLGIGAGWKRDEWLAYGYGFPETGERLAFLSDALEVITRMLAPGRATYGGRLARVEGAINVPKGVQQPRVPIMIGGNGPNVTWRLAAKHADELNLDGMSPDAVAESLPVVRQRCEEIGRDPDTLKVSLHIWRRNLERNRHEPPLSDQLAQLRELGIYRVMALLPGVEESDEVLPSFAQDVEAAGAELTAPVGV
jgi:F420-dependent oxidoreductase-like protein